MKAAAGGTSSQTGRELPLDRVRFYHLQVVSTRIRRLLLLDLQGTPSIATANVENPAAPFLPRDLGDALQKRGMQTALGRNFRGFHLDPALRRKRREMAV